jgi:hypothetical protein
MGWNLKKWVSLKGKGLETGTGKPFRPKEIPDPVGRYMVVNMNQDPDWVWNLKYVSRPVENRNKVFYIRVFSVIETTRRGATVMNYESLDDHPELVLCSGVLDKYTGVFTPDAAYLPFAGGSKTVTVKSPAP